MSAAGDGDMAATATAKSERETDRVQHQTRGTGGADVEAIRSRLDGAGMELKIAATQRCATQLSVANGRRRLDAHQVLGMQSRFGPVGANADQSERFASQQRQCETGPQDLPTAFAERSVDFNECCHV